MKTLLIPFAVLLTILPSGGCDSRDAGVPAALKEPLAKLFKDEVAPDCSDPRVIKMANKIANKIYDKLSSEMASTVPVSSLLDMSVGETTLVAYDEAIKARSCVGKLVVTANKSSLDKVNEYLIAIRDLSIKYRGNDDPFTHVEADHSFPRDSKGEPFNRDGWGWPSVVISDFGKPPYASLPIEVDVVYVIQMNEKSQGEGYRVQMQIPAPRGNMSNGKLLSVNGLVDAITRSNKDYPEVEKILIAMESQ